MDFNSPRTLIKIYATSLTYIFHLTSQRFTIHENMKIYNVTEDTLLAVHIVYRLYMHYTEN